LTRELPPGIEVIDGGLAGLNLLGLIEGAEKVVFVDTVLGTGTDEGISVMESDEVAVLADQRFDHSSGLPYLLHMMPEVCQGVLPQVIILGVEGVPDQQTIEKASSLALKIVMENITGEEDFDD